MDHRHGVTVEVAIRRQILRDGCRVRFVSVAPVPMVLPCKFGIANALRARYWLSSGATLNAQGGSIGVQSGTVSFWGMQSRSATARHGRKAAGRISNSRSACATTNSILPSPCGLRAVQRHNRDRLDLSGGDARRADCHLFKHHVQQYEHTWEWTGDVRPCAHVCAVTASGIRRGIDQPGTRRGDLTMADYQLTTSATRSCGASTVL